MKVFSSLAVTTVALLLQGYAAAAVVGTAAVRTKAATDPCGVGTQVDDSTLELHINTVLSRDAQVRKETRVNVSTYQGKVLLVSQPSDSELSARAKQIVMGTGGTTEIFNEIRQGQPIGLDNTPNDIWVTIKARPQLLTNDQVRSSNMKVTAEDGEVFLLGLVTECEAKTVTGIASWVSGVRHVMTAFTFIK